MEDWEGCQMASAKGYTSKNTGESRRIAETTGVTDVMQARYVTSDGARWPLSPLSVRALFPVSTIALPLLPVLNV